jgi:membrane protease YdiL (CAAX protease family)
VKTNSASSLRRSLGEIIILLGAVITDFWILRAFDSFLYEIPALLLVIAVFLTSIRRRGGLERVFPHTTSSLARAWFETLVATSIVLGILIGWAATLRGSCDEIPLRIIHASAFGLVVWVGQHLVWATLQQVLLQLFLRPVMGQVLKKPLVATAATALVFGLLHLPCRALSISTVALVGLWMTLYSRHRRLLPVIVSHAVLSGVAYLALPPQWNCELNVGIVAQRRLPRYRTLRSPQTQEILEKICSQTSAGTNQAFIRLLYRDMLDRTPTDAEVGHWLDQMNEGLSRNRVALAFAGSDEFRKIRSVN